MGQRMSYQVRTAVFEGPLDLLLRLITERQLEITEVSLLDLVDEYLAHLALLPDLDLDSASEFLVIAATLIQLKARRLLPGSAGWTSTRSWPWPRSADRLLSRLLACLTYKDVAAVIAHRLEATGRMVGRYAGLDPGSSRRLPCPSSGHRAELASLAVRLLTRRREPELDHLDLDLRRWQLPSKRCAGASPRRWRPISRAHRPSRPAARGGGLLPAVLELARWGLVRPLRSTRTLPSRSSPRRRRPGAGE